MRVLICPDPGQNQYLLSVDYLCYMCDWCYFGGNESVIASPSVLCPFSDRESDDELSVYATTNN